MARTATLTTSRPALVSAVAGVVAAIAAAWVASRYLSLSVDARYSLAWGAELMRGRVPELTAPELTTPHPLPILAGALLAPLGAVAAADAYALLMALSFALLLVAVFRLACELGGLAAGAIAAVVVASRPRLDFFAAHGFIDVPFTALVLLAAALAARAPRANATAVLGLLAVAGLLRPEAWGLSLLYGAFVLLTPGSRAAGETARVRPLALAVLAVTAPLAWIGFDLALTGNAAHSLEGTRSGAIELERVIGVDQLWPALGAGIERLVGWPLGVAGVVVGAWALWVERLRPGQRFAVASAVVACGLGTFGVLAVAGLPLNDRYLLVPALGLACVASAGAGARARRPTALVPLAALGLALAALLAAAPTDLAETARMLDFSRQKHEADGDLERLLARPDVLAAIARCPRVTASGSGRAAAAALLERDPASVPISRSPVPPRGLVAISTAPSVRMDTPGVLRQGAWALVDRCG